MCTVVYSQFGRHAKGSSWAMIPVRKAERPSSDPRRSPHVKRCRILTLSFTGPRVVTAYINVPLLLVLLLRRTLPHPPSPPTSELTALKYHLRFRQP